MTMSNAHSWFCRGVVALLAIAGGLAILPAVRGQDIVDNFQNDKKLAAQKLEQEVEQAVLQAQKQKAKEPAAALAIMLTYQHILEKDTVLTKQRRDQLLGTVSQQVQVLQAVVDAQAKVKDAPPKEKTKKEKDEELYSKYGNAKPSGGSASGTAGKIIGGLKDNYDTSNGTKADKDKKVAGLLTLPSIGDVPPDGSGVVYPKDWVKKTELKKFLAGKQLTEEEASLIKAMNSVLSVDYVKQPFQKVMENLEERTGQKIVIDPNAIKALQGAVEYTSPVTFTASKVSFRLTLKKILGDLGLAYILKNGVVWVVTPDVATQTMTTRTYPIGDLMPPPMPGQGMFFNLQREQFFANQIMQTIIMTVEPQSWAINNNGNGGTIWYNPATKSITVRQSAEMHLNFKASMGGY